VKVLCSQAFARRQLWESSPLRSLRRACTPALRVCALVCGSPRDIRCGEQVRKPLIFMHFHGVPLGYQHAIQSKQHNGKVSCTTALVVCATLNTSLSISLTLILDFPQVAITMDYRYPGRAGALLSRENDDFVRQRPALTPHDVRISWRSAKPCAP
jgi:hypothetical protein